MLLIKVNTVILVLLFNDEAFSVEKTYNARVLRPKTYPRNEHFGKILNI